jgi:3'-phosphoadenosine 5'-phosphosulfate sulfotransferase
MSRKIPITQTLAQKLREAADELERLKGWLHAKHPAYAHLLVAIEQVRNARLDVLYVKAELKFVEERAAP